MSDHLSFSLIWLHQLKIETSAKDVSQKGEKDSSINPPGDIFLSRDVLRHLLGKLMASPGYRTLLLKQQPRELQSSVLEPVLLLRGCSACRCGG